MGRDKFDPATLTGAAQGADRKGTQVLHLHGYGATTFGRICAWPMGHPVDPARARQSWRHAVVPEGRRSAAGAAHGPGDRGLGVHRGVHDPRAEDAGREDEGGLPRRAARRVRAAAQPAGGGRRAGVARHRAGHHRGGHRHATDAGEGQRVPRRRRPADRRAPSREAHVFIVGEGELQGELEAQARALGLGDRLHFIGFQRDVANVLSAYDLLVFPSLWEGTPLTVVRSAGDGEADRRDRRRRTDGRAERRRGRAGRAQARLAARWRTRSCADRDPARRASARRRSPRTSRRYDIDAFVRKMERLYELMARVSRPPGGGACCTRTCRSSTAASHRRCPATTRQGRSRERPAGGPLGRLWSEPGAVATVDPGPAAARVRPDGRVPRRGVRLPERRRHLLQPRPQHRATTSTSSSSARIWCGCGGSSRRARRASS